VQGSRQIHEIGTRAHVLAVHACPADHVARAVERVARTPVPPPTRAWLRPSMG
jgi:hypothetical protein